MEIKKENTGKIISDNTSIPKLKNYKSSNKSYVSISLVSVFLLVFLGFLVFEFYHVVNNVDPSIRLEQQEEEKLAGEVDGSFKRMLKFLSQLGDKIIVKKDKEVQEKPYDSSDKEQDIQVLKKEDTKTSQQDAITSAEQSDSDNFAAKTSQQDAITSAEQSDSDNIVSTTTSIENNIVSVNEGKEYSIQLMAVSEEGFGELERTAKFLIKQGYYAYIYRIPFAIKTKNDPKGEYYYRLRVGFFPTKTKAVRSAYALIKKYPKIVKNYFVALPLQEEYNSNFFIVSPETEGY